jgi:exopolyphosphatase/guanosine-5'-triphosphate,3'-diphosphate pyrophosphatase
MERVACIDIGTVTCRLAVAEVEGDKVQRLAKSSNICNLGQDLTATGMICDEARDRVLACIDQYLASTATSGAQAVCCTLTSAARDASNSGELLSALEGRGLRPMVIPGEVEGSLTFLGVAQDFPGQRILVADNGGGSTELALGTLSATGLELEAVRSENVGCRRITERFLSAGDPPSPDDIAAARAFADGPFANAAAEERIAVNRPSRLVVTGGTVTSLVAIEKRLQPYDPHQVHLATLSRAQVEGLVMGLTSMTVAQRRELPGLQPKRAGVILGGAVAIAELMAQTGFDELTVSESDLLFGLSLCAAATMRGDQTPVGWKPLLAPVR